jgi:putative hydrolase of HD superfamily
MSDPEAIAYRLVRFLHRIGRLKAAKRTGWLDRGVPKEEAESVADHSFRTGILAWLAAGEDLDRDKVLKLALVHDLAEALTGDIPPYDVDSLPPEADAAARREFLERRHIRPAGRTESKRAAEAVAIADLIADLPSARATEIAALTTELAEGASAEARFVKQADKIETYLQSREYLQSDPSRPMASFAAEVAETIDIPELIALRDAIGRL